jgi:hypothetical protein
MNDININDALARENLAKSLLTLRASKEKNKEEMYAILQNLQNSEYYSLIKNGKITDKDLREDIKKMADIETSMVSRE